MKKRHLSRIIQGWAKRVEVVKEYYFKWVIRPLPRSIRPNHITIFRLVIISPVLAVSLLLGYPWWWNELLILVGFISDGLDGTLARERHQATPLGAFLDGLTDKLMVVPALWILGLQKIDWTIFSLLVIRDLIIVSYSAYAVYSRGQKQIKGNRPGKWYMAVLCVLLQLMVLRAPTLWINLTALLTVIIGCISLPYYWQRDTKTTTT